MADRTATLAAAVLALAFATETTGGAGFGRNGSQAQSMHSTSRIRLFFEVVIGLLKDHAFPFSRLPIVVNPLAQRDEHSQRCETAEDHASRFCDAIDVLVHGGNDCDPAPGDADRSSPQVTEDFVAKHQTMVRIGGVGKSGGIAASKMARNSARVSRCGANTIAREIGRPATQARAPTGSS